MGNLAGCFTQGKRMSDLSTGKSSILALTPTELLPFVIELRTKRRNSVVAAATRRTAVTSVVKKLRQKKTNELVQTLSLEQVQSMLTQLQDKKAST